jgi:orotate phosphoribosyltransferase-like protein
MGVAMNSFHFRVPGAWPTERQIAAMMDEYAELASKGMERREIADSMGITGGTACSLWCRICARYGERAQ